jgi:hypothetical protein
MEIKKILKRGDGLKYIIIPKNSKLECGDYVKIVKIQEEENSQ